MSVSGCFSLSRRSLLYLVEPLVAFFAAVLLVVLLQPQESEMPARLVELHAQDALSVMQQDGTFEGLYLWFLGNESQHPETGIDGLVRALNPNYGWQVEVKDGERSRKLGAGHGGDVVSASRDLVKDWRFFTIRLNIFYR